MIGLSRMISISARGGIDIYTIIDQLNSTGSCPSYTVRRATKGDTSKGSCCPMAVGNALLEMYLDVQEELKEQKIKEGGEAKPVPKPKAVAEKKAKVVCPECGEMCIRDRSEAIPAFFAGFVMALCSSISYGIATGFIFYCIVKICKKETKEIHPILWVCTFLFVLNFVLLALL